MSKKFKQVPNDEDDFIVIEQEPKRSSIKKQRENLTVDDDDVPFEMEWINPVDIWQRLDLNIEDVLKKFKLQTRGKFKDMYKHKNNVCLFHGTSQTQIENFELEGTTNYKFYITFDLNVALKYAQDRCRKDKNSRPTLLVFMMDENNFLKFMNKIKSYKTFTNDRDICIKQERQHMALQQHRETLIISLYGMNK